MSSYEFDLLTVNEVSGLLGLRKPRIYALVREGALPAVHFGRQIRIDKSILYEWVRAGGQPLPGGWRRSDEPILEREESHGKR